MKVQPQCQRHSDCADQEVCHKGSCQYACRLLNCGENAACTASQHLARCECLPGAQGNPTILCKYCMYNHSYVLCMCLLHVNFLLAKPDTAPSVEAGCSNNDDCPDYTACQNRKCINPCAKNDPCARLAMCRVVNHEVICTCPDGYIGSPYTSCERRKYI